MLQLITLGIVIRTQAGAQKEPTRRIPMLSSYQKIIVVIPQYLIGRYNCGEVSDDPFMIALTVCNVFQN
jgi:hypothetical protein